MAKQPRCIYCKSHINCISKPNITAIPCAFGPPALEYTGPFQAQVQCPVCGAAGPFKSSVFEAVQAFQNPKYTQEEAEAPQFHFHTGEDEDGSRLLKSVCSQKLSKNCVFVGSLHTDGGLFGDFGSMEAVVSIAMAARWGVPVFEVDGMARKPDSTCRLTQLLAPSLKLLRRKLPKIGLVTAVIPVAGDCAGAGGAVFRAASWNYHGIAFRVWDGMVIDGELWTKQACRDQLGTCSVAKLKEKYPDKEIERHFDAGSRVYWKALNGAGRHTARQLHLQSLPYPKRSR